MNSLYRDKLRDAFQEYLNEFGGNYNEETFIDFVVSTLIEPGDAVFMIRWYREHAKKLENRMNEVMRAKYL